MNTQEGTSTCYRNSRDGRKSSTRRKDKYNQYTTERPAFQDSTQKNKWKSMVMHEAHRVDSACLGETAHVLPRWDLKTIEWGRSKLKQDRKIPFESLVMVQSQLEQRLTEDVSRWVEAWTPSDSSKCWSHNGGDCLMCSNCFLWVVMASRPYLPIYAPIRPVMTTTKAWIISISSGHPTAPLLTFLAEMQNNEWQQLAQLSQKSLCAWFLSTTWAARKRGKTQRFCKIRTFYFKPSQ